MKKIIVSLLLAILGAIPVYGDRNDASGTWKMSSIYYFDALPQYGGERTLGTNEWTMMLIDNLVDDTFIFNDWFTGIYGRDRLGIAVDRYFVTGDVNGGLIAVQKSPDTIQIWNPFSSAFWLTSPDTMSYESHWMYFKRYDDDGDGVLDPEDPYAYYGSGHTYGKGYLVPLPGTILLFGSALICLMGFGANLGKRKLT